MAGKKNILIIGEFPVIHKGYASFFSRVLKDFPGADFYFGFLDKGTIEQLTSLEPDIRALPSREIKKIIEALLPGKQTFLVNKKNVSRLISRIRPSKIVILKGEKSQNFAENFLKKHRKLLKYYDVSLKWNSALEFKKKKTALSKKESREHKAFMDLAFVYAQNAKCWWRQVGSVLVKNKKVVLKSFNQMLPSDDECYKIGCIRDSIKPGKMPEICSVVHAEASIIAKAAQKGISLKDTVLYVTHFPCSACSKLVALSGIRKLVYSRGSSVFDGARVMQSRGVKIIKI